MNAARLKTARILAVDDDETSTCLLLQFLFRGGYTHLQAIHDSYKVLEAIPQFKPDLILLDLAMPGMNGLEIMSRLQEWCGNDPAPPVLVVTGDDCRETKRKVMVAGGAGVLCKPFDPSDLLMIARDLIEARLEQRELRQENARLSQEAALHSREVEKALAVTQQGQGDAVRHQRLRSLAEVADGVVHNFNNALMAIIGYSELLIQEPEILANREMALEYLRMVNSAGREASLIVRHLRDSSLPGKEDDDMLCFGNVNQLLEEVVAVTKPKWQDHALAQCRTVTMNLELGEVPEVLCNTRQLREAAKNLLFNAVDALPSGGTITLRTRREGDDVVWEVSDDGVGMSAETRVRCLEPFFSTKGKESTGLGLTIVNKAVQSHGGRLEVESEEGRGTTFRVRLPSTAAELEGADTLPPGSKPLRVLVADDDRIVRDVVTRYLHMDGHEVVAVGTAREALERSEAGVFDLVIADYGMPGMSGAELGRRLRPKAAPLPFILMTGYIDAPCDPKSVGAGRILTKPIYRETLRRAVAEAVGGGHSMQSAA